MDRICRSCRVGSGGPGGGTPRHSPTGQSVIAGVTNAAGGSTGGASACRERGEVQTAFKSMWRWSKPSWPS